MNHHSRYNAWFESDLLVFVRVRRWVVLKSPITTRREPDGAANILFHVARIPQFREDFRAPSENLSLASTSLRNGWGFPDTVERV